MEVFHAAAILSQSYMASAIISPADRTKKSSVADTMGTQSGFLKAIASETLFSLSF